MRGQERSETREALSQLPAMTNEAVEMLRVASTNNPDGVDIGDLLATMTLDDRGEGRWLGRVVVDTFLLGEDREGFRKSMISLSDGSRERREVTSGKIKLDESSKALIAEAEAISNGVIGTGDLLLAEISRKESLVRLLMEQAGVLGSVSFASAKEIMRISSVSEAGNIKADFSVSKKRSERRAGNETESAETEIRRDLAEQARNGELGEVVIRKKQVADILAGMTEEEITVMVADNEVIARNILEGMAEMIKNGKGLDCDRLIVVDKRSLVENAEAEIRKALAECGERGILYFPEIDQYLSGKGGKELRMAIAKGQVRVLTSMTESVWGNVGRMEEFRKTRPIFVEEPSCEETAAILKAKKEEMEAGLSGVVFTDEAIEMAANLANKHYRVFAPPVGAEKLLSRAAMETGWAMDENLRSKIGDGRFGADGKVEARDVVLALEKLTGIKTGTENEAEKLLKMEDSLKERIIGQDEAVGALAEMIIQSRVGFRNGDTRPIGSFMFVGPSGVGKTELAKVLADYMFDGEQSLIQINMSEFSERHTVSKLIGSPPGYEGHKEGGRLTEAVRKKPYSVVLFDEIEKAHPDVIMALMPLLEEGTMTDGQGRDIPFKNCVVIMTGNPGSEYYEALDELTKRGKSREEALVEIKEAVAAEMRNEFRPEFLNRFDETVMFNPLTIDQIAKILDIQMRKFGKTLKERDIEIELSEEARKMVAGHGYRPEHGARSIRRAVQALIKGPLSRKLLEGKIENGQKVRVEVGENGLKFSTKTAE